MRNAVWGRHIKLLGMPDLTGPATGVMTIQENGGSPKPGGKGSLDGLARRLGALEESLTVVAGELGVSAVPQFKRLDPEAVYQEAIRRAQQATEPLRIALRKLDTDLHEVLRNQAQLKQELAANGERHASVESVAALASRLTALNSQTDALIRSFGLGDEKFGELNDRVDRLSLRLDALREQLDADAREKRHASSRETPEAVLLQRLALIESRLDRLAHDKSGETSSASTPDAQSHQLIAAEVARQITDLVREAGTAPAPTQSLLSESPLEKLSEPNPLVMNAAERAIVRLTRRLEKLEQWKQGAAGDSKPGRGLMGRLFES
jgi:DNA repair exonuclease SbcCD ATPase subunit